jgi:hypothetical protein
MNSEFGPSEDEKPSDFEASEPSTSEDENTEMSNGSDTEASSQYELSETSEDRAFVVPDSETTSYAASIASASGSNPFLDDDTRYNDIEEVKVRKVASMLSERKLTEQELPSSAEKHPIRTTAQRSVGRNGKQVLQYLVLWYSWEDMETW